MPYLGPRSVLFPVLLWNLLLKVMLMLMLMLMMSPCPSRAALSLPSVPPSLVPPPPPLLCLVLNIPKRPAHEYLTNVDGLVPQILHINTPIVPNIPTHRVRHTDVQLLVSASNPASDETSTRSFGGNMITVVTRPVPACVTACNRTTAAKQVHNLKHKEKSQKTTPETLLGHRRTASSTAQCRGSCLVPNPPGTCREPEALPSISTKKKAAQIELVTGPVTACVAAPCNEVTSFITICAREPLGVVTSGHKKAQKVHENANCM